MLLWWPLLLMVLRSGLCFLVHSWLWFRSLPFPHWWLVSTCLGLLLPLLLRLCQLTHLWGGGNPLSSAVECDFFPSLLPWCHIVLSGSCWLFSLFLFLCPPLFEGDRQAVIVWLWGWPLLLWSCWLSLCGCYWLCWGRLHVLGHLLRLAGRWWFLQLSFGYPPASF